VDVESAAELVDGAHLRGVLLEAVDVRVGGLAAAYGVQDALTARRIARGATRHEAIDRLVEALGAFRIEGIKHNIPALCAILASEEFREGRVHTGLAAEVVARTPAEAKP